ncbi:hypothetical protein MKX03_010874 [Papaver bracteatum]|nr:hypothetical protein MKX03_010874 [Papaver bracteatum]
MDNTTNKSYLVTTFYGNAYPNKLDSWKNVMKLADKVKLPWMIIGDLNVVLTNEEKEGLRPLDINKALIFNDVISNMRVQDIGFTGYPFTWCNQRMDNGRVEERLDRSFCNDEWIKLFPQTTLFHLVARGSDHFPIIIKTNPGWKDGAYPYKYFGGWMKHTECKRIIMEVWDTNLASSASYSVKKIYTM